MKVTCLMVASLAATMVHRVADAKPTDPDHEARIVVKTFDLDLATPNGQRRLERRIRAAAAAVCPGSDVTRQLRPSMVCWREAYRGAVAERDRLIARAVGAGHAVRSDRAVEPSRTSEVLGCEDEAEGKIRKEPVWPVG